MNWKILLNPYNWILINRLVLWYRLPFRRYHTNAACDGSWQSEPQLRRKCATGPSHRTPHRVRGREDRRALQQDHSWQRDQGQVGRGVVRRSRERDYHPSLGWLRETAGELDIFGRTVYPIHTYIHTHTFIHTYIAIRKKIIVMWNIFI